MIVNVSKTLVLFDIDGTILRTFGAGKEAFDLAFLELYQIDKVFGPMSVQGRTDLDIIEEVSQRALGRPLDPPEVQVLADRYVAHLRETLPRAERFTVMPGVKELIEVLADENRCLLGVQTGNLEAAAALKLERAGLAHHFEFGGYGSDAFDRKEIIRKAIERARKLSSEPIERVIAIGDSPNDVQSGRANGADTIGVLTGGLARDVLESSEPDLLLETLELTDELRRFFRLR